jgi:hypothetical protein
LAAAAPRDSRGRYTSSAAASSKPASAAFRSDPMICAAGLSAEIQPSSSAVRRRLSPKRLSAVFQFFGV